MRFTKQKPAKPSENEKNALTAKRESLQAVVAAKQPETTVKLRAAAKLVHCTPPAGGADLFLTESNPGTPDPAETFRVFQRELAAKRESGTRTDQEEDAFPVA